MFYNEDDSLDGVYIAIFIVILALLLYVLLTPKKTSAPVAAAPVSKFTLHKGKDIPGNDIECINSVPAKVCEDKCLANPNCKSYVDVKPGNPWWGGAYGCCYKNASVPITPLGEQIDAFVRN